MVGVAKEDDPKNHNKQFVAKIVGEYSDENSEKVFSEIAHKYGGEIPLQFNWGYAIAWHDGNSIKVVSDVATTDASKIKIVDKISPKKIPGFCFASISQVLIGNKWRYDSELTEDESWEAYWDLQAKVIKKLIEKSFTSI